MKSCNMGGQAVIEGVMMRYRQSVAVAVRQQDGSIKVGRTKYGSITEKHKWMKWPIIRGMVGFIDSLVLGVKTLMYSADIAIDEAEEEDKAEKKAKEAAKKAEASDAEAAETADNGVQKKKNSGVTTHEKMEDKKMSGKDSAMMAGTVAFSVVFAVALFILAPYFLSTLLTKYAHLDSTFLLAVIEGIIKLGIFIAYMALISKMEDIKRTFMYHGAEHKCINCIESGKELNVTNVMASSKEHRRCGTSFIFIVLFISIIFFIFIRLDNVWLRLLIRLALVPIIAGVSYEFIKWAGNSDSDAARVLSRPGLLVQGLTTKEPTEDMVEVAIASVNAVFDWKRYLSDMKKQMEMTGNRPELCATEKYGDMIKTEVSEEIVPEQPENEMGIVKPFDDCEMTEAEVQAWYSAHSSDKKD